VTFSRDALCQEDLEQALIWNIELVGEGLDLLKKCLG
jgi:hypothetical protein